MADIIHLLSDHIANQIAAGEVIQRPASAVKELLENAIDAGATEIQLVIKDAGKELIQVVDNGKGMSPTDARMSFERHATSKIRNIDDLFTIRTMGFRGEALASIAAVTQVELKTRQPASDTGTRVIIEGTEVKLQEPCAIPPGTNICLKNLFFNVPARRNFLKSNTAELKAILDEFTRVAMAYPGIGFRFTNNGQQQFQLAPGSLKARIVGLIGGSGLEKKLVPVEEHTDLLNITGFIGKPESATRTRGNQFFFINNRFIRNAYLNHAVVKAYDALIEKEAFPLYVLFLEVDPSRVDVNVHPTKQEVKFEDDQVMYAYLNATVKHALARYNIAPSLDFSLNKEIQHLASVQQPITEQQREQTQKGYLYNVFTDKNQAHQIERRDSLKEWKNLYEIANAPELQQAANTAPPLTIPSQTPLYNDSEQRADGNNNMMLVHGDMLATTVKSGMILIHIRRARERIWFERLHSQWASGGAPSQKSLFPMSYELALQDALILGDALADMARIGFDIARQGQQIFIIQGTPPGMPSGDEKNVIDEIVENLKHEAQDITGNRTERLLAYIAKSLTRHKSAMEQPENQQALIDELFACTQPEYTPTGKKVFVLIKTESLEGMLG